MIYIAYKYSLWHIQFANPQHLQLPNIYNLNCIHMCIYIYVYKNMYICIIYMYIYIA